MLLTEVQMKSWPPSGMLWSNFPERSPVWTEMAGHTVGAAWEEGGLYSGSQGRCKWRLPADCSP